MRGNIKSCFALVVIQILLSGNICAWATSHRYDTGIMTAISSDVIVMSGRAYNILPKTKVVLKIKDSKGAYYEYKGRLSNLKVGEKIFLKVTGYNILEVEVLR